MVVVLQNFLVQCNRYFPVVDPAEEKTHVCKKATTRSRRGGNASCVQAGDAVSPPHQQRQQQQEGREIAKSPFDCLDDYYPPIHVSNNRRKEVRAKRKRENVSFGTEFYGL